MRSVLSVLLPLALVGPVVAQPTYSRAATPEAAALDRLNLKAEWSAFVPVQHRQDGLARVQPVDENQVFVQTKGGLLVALDAATGKEQWKYKFPAGFTEGFAVGANDQFVYSVNVAKLYCHQRYTGVLEFDFDLPEAPAVGPVTDGDQLYVTFTSGKMACYDLPPAFQTSAAAKKRAGEMKLLGNSADDVVARSPGRVVPSRAEAPEAERFHVPPSYFESGFGLDNNQPTYSVAALQKVTPPFFLGGLNKVVSVSMLPSVQQPYTLKPEYLTYNQLTPSVAVIPPSLARLYQLSNLRPPPFTPKMRWIVETRGKVYAEPIFVPESAFSAPRVWIAEDGRYLQAVIRDRDEREKEQQVWKLAANTAAGIAGPYSYAKGKSLAFLPLSDGQVLAIDLYGGNPQSPRYEFRTNVGGLLNRLPIGAADGVYVGGDRSGSSRINVKTGEVDWRTDADVDRVVAVNDTHVFARDRKGTLHMYAKGKADPNTLLARPVGSLAASDFGVTVANGVTDRVLLAADNGLVVCLKDADAKGKPKLIAPVVQADPKDPKPGDPKPGDPKPGDPKPPEKK